MFCLPLFIVYISDIFTIITKGASNTLHTDDLAIWNACEHTTTVTYRMQEAIDGVNKWTQDWGLEINIAKKQQQQQQKQKTKNKTNKQTKQKQQQQHNTNKQTNSTRFFLTIKELRLKDEIVPQTDTPTFLGVKLDTRLTWKPQI